MLRSSWSWRFPATDTRFLAGVNRVTSPAKSVYVNVLIDVTKDCDCLDKKQKKEIPDIGVLASTDIVAVDQATMDITNQVYGQNIGEKFYPKLNGFIQIEHAEKIGMGKRKYQLVAV